MISLNTLVLKAFFMVKSPAHRGVLCQVIEDSAQGEAEAFLGQVDTFGRHQFFVGHIYIFIYIYIYT